MTKSLTMSLIVLAAAASASAQTKFTMSGKCSKPDVQQVVPSGDAPDHMMSLTQGKCVPTKAAEIGRASCRERVLTDV